MMFRTLAENARFKYEFDDSHPTDFCIQTDKYTHGVRVVYIDDIPPDTFAKTPPVEYVGTIPFEE